MNREIKFRAWDREQKKMFQLRYLSLQSDTFYTDKNAEGDGKVKEAMQFTGLKDKNGVEIYEGDIVQVYHLPSNNPEHPEWDCIPCFTFTADMTNGDCYKWTMTEKTREVIGNIYDKQN